MTKILVFETVKNNGYCLRYASDKIRKDKKIIIGAFKNIFFVEYIEYKRNKIIIGFHKILEFYEKKLRSIL